MNDLAQIARQLSDDLYSADRLYHRVCSAGIARIGLPDFIPDWVRYADRVEQRQFYAHKNENELVPVVRSASPGCLPTWQFANYDGDVEEIRNAFEGMGETVYEVAFVDEEEANELVFGP